MRSRALGWRNFLADSRMRRWKSRPSGPPSRARRGSWFLMVAEGLAVSAVGGGGGDEVEEGGGGRGFEWGKKVAAEEGDAVGDLVSFGILLGDGEGLGRDVGGGEKGGGKLLGEGGGKDSGAGTEVEDDGAPPTATSAVGCGGGGGRGPFGMLADLLDDEFDKGFGVGAGNQHVAGDGEFQREEPGFSDE